MHTAGGPSLRQHVVLARGRKKHIGKIIASQRFVNTDYVKELKKDLGNNFDSGAVFDFCMKPPLHSPPPMPLQTSQNTFVYSDANPNFKYLGGYQKPVTSEDVAVSSDGGLPVAAITLFFGYDYGVVNAYQINKRIILNNGFHRLYTLKILGIEYAPVVLQKVHYPELEFPQIFKNLPRDYLLSHPRPAMIRGFLNEERIIKLKMKNMVSNIRVSWNIDQFYAPPA